MVVNIPGQSGRRPSNASAHHSGINMPPEPMAIIGMAMRLPGSIHSGPELWDFLISKKDAGGPVPPNRYNIDSFQSDSGRPGTIKTKRGYFLSDSDGLDHIDSAFFTMSKTEVESMDPQQRMLLEVVYELLENSGMKNYKGANVACIVGTFGEDFQDLTAKDVMSTGPHKVAGSGDWALSGRPSYQFGLQGPAITVQGACSSSLTGIHIAIRSIQAGDCTSAIVAGTSLIMSPSMTIAMTEQGVLSPDGNCKTFSTAANGYARAEAINAILIKPLSHALRDRDAIRAVIRGSGICADGKTVGFFRPSADAHEKMIRRAYEEAHLNPHHTAYVECHGTGTPVGDPIETDAIARCFGNTDHPTYIGSVKPNLGHSEGASGITSVLKAVLALEHETIPPNIKCNDLKSDIPWARGLKVPTTGTDWPIKQVRASINSFGIGGANAHVILESVKSYMNGNAKFRQAFHSKLNDPSTNNVHILPLTAHSQYSLTESIAVYESYITAKKPNLQDLSYTLANRREHHLYRTFAVGSSESQIAFPTPIRAALEKSPQLTFMFTGQGAQWAQMGLTLIDDFPSFQKDIETMNGILQSLPDKPDWTIRGELQKLPSRSRVNEAEFSQPLCTIIQVGLVNLLARWGITPRAVVGHSSGEIAAAYAAGALTMAEAVIVAFYRGQTSDHPVEGGMAAVGLSNDEAQRYLVAGVMIACINSPQSVTLSGDKEALVAVIDDITLKQPGTFAKLLPVKMAYHSHHMVSYGAPYEQLLQKHITPKKPEIPFFSSVTGRLWTKFLGPEYWRMNLENPVLFHPAVATCLQYKVETQMFVEVGPHALFSGPLKQIFKYENAEGSLYESCLRRNENSSMCLLRAVGTLWAHGCTVRLDKLTGQGQFLTDLPLYSWQHDQSFWSESRVSRGWRLRKFGPHELLGNRTMESNDLQPQWRNILSLKDVPWIRDHKVLKDVLFPFAGYVAMAGEAIRQVAFADSYIVKDIAVPVGLVLNESKDVEMMLCMSPVRLSSLTNSEWWDFEISSFDGNNWTSHARGSIKDGANYIADPVTYARFPRPVKDPYPGMSAVGLNYGEKFRGLQDVTALPNAMTASASLTSPPDTECVYAVHPTNIDHCLQLILTAQTDGLARKIDRLHVPISIGELYVAGGHQSLNIKALAQASTVSSGLTGKVTAMIDDKVILSLQSGKFSPLETDIGNDNQDSIAGARLSYKADLDFVPVHELIKPAYSASVELVRLEEYALLCIIEIKSRILNLPTKLPFAELFRKWIVWQVERASKGNHPSVSNSETFTSIKEAARNVQIMETRASFLVSDACYPAIELITRVLDNCVAVMNGVGKGIEILIQGNGLIDFYNWLEGRTNARKWFDLLGHSNPVLRVLEIGAGTGGTTAVVLKGFNDAAGDGQHRMYASYTFTDISAGFLTNARVRFAKQEGIVYQILDISKDPIAQGFQAESFDLIVAANVLHATPALTETLKNVRKLLAPGGRLFLQELSPEVESVNLVMGILPDWWLGGADGRDREPYITPERWDKELKAAGFLGVESAVYDDDQPVHLNANIIARPAPSSSTSIGNTERVTLLVGRNTESGAMISAFESVLVQGGFKFDYCTLGEQPKRGQDIISLLEVEYSIFANISEETLEKVKDLMRTLEGSGILWVTGSNSDPRLGMVSGFARTQRYETPGIAFATLQLEKLSSRTINATIPIFRKFSRRDATADVDAENEWIVNSEGVITIGRYQTVDAKNDIEEGLQGSEVQLVMGRVKKLSTLRWSPYQVRACETDEVVIAMEAVGFNHRDVLISQGVIDGQIGFEGAGTIRQVGLMVNNLVIGDRVMMLGSQASSTMAVVPALQAFKIPDTMSWEEAATIPFAFATAVHVLRTIGFLDNDYEILIHNAHEGIGLAALQLCMKVLNCRCYVTTSTGEQAQWLTDTFGLTRDRIFCSIDASFVRDILTATRGRGVDLLLNNLSGELLHASWSCIAEDGKMIHLDQKDVVGKGHLQLQGANCSQAAADIALFAPEKLQSLLATTMKYIVAGMIQPLGPINSFTSVDVGEACRLATLGEYMGKVVVNLPDVIPDTLKLAGSTGFLSLKADKAYLLVGGLGGLGRSIAAYLIEHGARHLVFLGRSAGVSIEDEDFKKELESQSCTVQMIRGSVSVLEDVQRCVKSTTKPIAGVLQLSMVLRDSTFARMTHEDWLAAVGPKVGGTYNLHNSLGNNLDFFVSTSSISGSFGNAGQSNYAAANSFLDHFTAWRKSLGLNASVLDVGVVGGVGYLSDAGNVQIQERLKLGGAYTLCEQDVLDAVKWAILRGHPSTESQLAIGIRTTKPLDDDACRVNWKRDRRMAAYRNIDTAGTVVAVTTATDVFAEIIQKLASDPELLDKETTKADIKQEIGRQIYAFMNKASEEPDLKATLSQLGVDSLVAIQVREYIRRVTAGIGGKGGVEISTLELIGSGGVGAVGELVIAGMQKKVAE